MNGNKFLLDTNTILYLLNGDKTVADFLFNKQFKTLEILDLILYEG